MAGINEKKKLVFELGQDQNRYAHRTDANNPRIRQKAVRRFMCRKPDMRRQIDDDGNEGDLLPPEKIKSMNRNRKTTAERHDLHRALLLISIWNHTFFLHEFLALIGVRKEKADDDTDNRYVYKPSQQREMVIDMFIFMLAVQYRVKVHKNIEDIVAIATCLFPEEPKVGSVMFVLDAETPFAVDTSAKEPVVFEYVQEDGTSAKLEVRERRVAGVFFPPKLIEPGVQLPFYTPNEVAEDDLYEDIAQTILRTGPPMTFPRKELSQHDPRAPQQYGI